MPRESRALNFYNHNIAINVAVKYWWNRTTTPPQNDDSFNCFHIYSPCFHLRGCQLRERFYLRYPKGPWAAHGVASEGYIRFDIDDTGRFEVHLDQACNAKFESQLHFDTNVSGTLSYGQIGALSGISAQELFLWFPVKGIGVDVPSSGLIYFIVGVVVKQLPLSMFETPKDCMAVGDFESGDSIPDDDLLAESIAKSQSAKLGHELDQGSLGGTICRKVGKSSCALVQSV
ncbi:hypothetical protein ES332_D07G193800v1 [Gossypium tomentosum]|uniref:Uncharacterized protein n=1 Tax=Gossypium tomentosum TaxID=34277 RepID=A0A5D2K938_GOSTO|nr:hypothetical protein ES332_D07G193800v1 [Gossypium tomentosum]